MAMPIVLFPNVIFSSISSLLVPEFAAYQTKRRYVTIKKVTSIVLGISFILCLFISLILLVFANPLGQWIYKDPSISNYIKILAPLAIFTLFDSVVDNILKGLDAQNDVMMINILDTFMDVILIYSFVPKFGIARISGIDLL